MTRTSRYQRPDWFTEHVTNPVVGFLIRRGATMRGARMLSVPGRKSGEWRSVPVNLLETEHGSYLVAPRGNTEWSRNLREAGKGRLLSGKRVTEFDAEEITDAAKPEILRTYLTLWKSEVGRFFGGLGADATDQELLAIAPGYPVFRIQEKQPTQRV